MNRALWVSSRPLGRRLVERLLHNSNCEEEEMKGWEWSLGEMRYIEERSSWDGVHVCAHTLNHTHSPPWTLFCRLPLQCSVFSCLRILQRAGKNKRRFCPSGLVSLNHMISLSDAIVPMVLVITVHDHPCSFRLHTYPLILYATSNSGTKICYAMH